MELNRIHHCSAIELLTSLIEPPALMACDPPYGVEYRHTTMGKTPAMKNGVYQARVLPRDHNPARFSDNVIDTTWIPYAFDALAAGGAMYLFTRWDVLHHWHAAAIHAGFKVVQRIVWDKCLWGAGNLDYYGSQTEDILVCVKGAHRMRWDRREGNVWRIGRGRVTGKDGGGRHQTQKPTDLFKRIITYSSDVNDLFVDPFTGSGAACVAAQKLHRRFVGCDINPDFAASAQAWIEKTSKHTLPMFA